MNIKNESITSRDVDFAQWYTDVCLKAELMDYSETKGFIIYRPYGYAIWEKIREYIDKEFKRLGVENVYMPLVIPMSLLKKEKDHIEGFAPECLVATKGGKDELQEELIIRPTSECVFTDHFAHVISSYRDLPLKYNQWCSVVRWEKTTRPFLRGSEFLWQELHSMHRSDVEAKEFALKILDVYDRCGKEALCIPFVKGKKSDKEKFAGALETYTIEALMHDGKSLQSGTTHFFGDGFAKAFNVQYLDNDGKVKTPFQTSCGASTRLLGAVIMVHGDDNGLVLPPDIAPIQAVIIPIQMQKEGVLAKAREIKEVLENAGIRVKLDDSDKTPGWKFSEYEMKGVPLRIEIGPRDLKEGVLSICKRVDGSKEVIKIEEAKEEVLRLFDEIKEKMYQKALHNLLENIKEVHSYKELEEALANGGYAKAMWCGDEACENKVKEDFQATLRCIPFDQVEVDDVCPVCGKKAKYMVYFAKAY